MNQIFLCLAQKFVNILFIDENTLRRYVKKNDFYNIYIKHYKNKMKILKIIF
jgi:hypothetical protein